MKILDYKYYYFLGIGGIGMSALARYFNHFKKKVSGYDKTQTTLTNSLQNEGIDCFFNEDVERLKKLLSDYKREEVLIVYTPAVPNSHVEFQYLLNNNYILQKRSQVLGEITKQFKTIAIAGTHGKTTTTTMVTHLLKNAGVNCFSFMGGISKNYNTNLLLGDPNQENTYVVVEADEYDRSFLTLSPYFSIITSCDADHLDIYGSHHYVKESYELFAQKINKNGLLVVNKNVDNDLSLPSNKVIYSLNLNTNYVAENVRFKENEAHFDLVSPVENIKDLTLGITGAHNVENSIAAIAVAQQVGIKGADIKEALRSFSGVKRRFDFRVKTNKVVYIDDYAHHPEELKATISSVRKIYPNKKITGIFQPHLFSRTRDFANEFASSLDLLDEIFLLEIYPARELPIEGITSTMLLNKLTKTNKKVISKENLLKHIKENEFEVLLTMGAGDIDSLIT
ncbi:MAG: UDP-N-acetylmuramate--L-alanine ligase, partial [Bacteroidia bacterium]|nr:UDP-N-acetylmuramate--L-alanine ligase [Bacteroidia bacterium]